MSGGWRIGRVRGIPITIHQSWLLIFGIVVWALASDYLPMHHPGLDGGGDWLWAVLAAILFFASVLAHELAHSLVARAQGIVVGGITLFALGGVSELGREATRPRVELVVALVGPLTSLGLAGAFWAAWQWLLPLSMPAAAVALYLAYANGALGLFNLIPGFPLDGGRVLRAAAWARTGDLERATRLAVRTGRVAAALLVAVGAWQAFAGAGANGFWLILVGWFLSSAAGLEGARVALHTALRGTTVETFVDRNAAVLAADSSVADAVVRISQAPPRALYPVVAEGSLLGALTPQDIAGFPVDRWRVTSVNWLTRHVGAPPALSLEADALEALARLDQARADALPVTDAGGRLVGTFERGAVQRWLELRGSVPA